MDDMINDYIIELCAELDISVPALSYDTTNFVSNTMLALYDGSTIYVRPFDKPNPDQLYAIAHELRHAWQIKFNKGFFFANYKKVNETDIETYNLQIAEIDANAYASAVMIDMFGLEPLYEGMSPKVISAIREYMIANFT